MNRPVSTEANDDGVAPPAVRGRGGIPHWAHRFGYAVLALLVLASGATAAGLYFEQYRPDKQTDSSVRQEVASSASDGTTAVLSYSSDTLDQDFDNARSHLAGEFLTYFNDFTARVVAPAAKQRPLKTSAEVGGAAVMELHPNSAVVLVFVNQTTTAKDNPKPITAVSSIRVHMNRIDGRWLITKFDPVH
ncbi:MAG: hypothetical protein WCI78_05005 [Mycobacterium sp.]